MKSTKAIIALIILAPIIGLSLAGLHVTYLLNRPYEGNEVQFTVDSGDTFGQVNSKLYRQGLVVSPRIFHYYARFQNKMEKMRAGTFTIPSGANTMDVLQILTSSTPILPSITIPEGKNIYEIAKILEEAQITTADEFLEEVKKSEYLEQVDIDGPSLEGYLYPNTYHFAPKTPVSTIVQTMVDEFKKSTEDILFTKSKLTKAEVITLASMVEKETGAKWERDIIAGVFFNRLHKKMRLQSDPTTIYGLYPNYAGNIRKEDLLSKTPYNTYAIPALPVGPICNPGRDAILATLNPAKHQYLYFVSKNDGTHIFSEHYEDHHKAVINFQKNRKNREGKSWRDLQNKTQE